MVNAALKNKLIYRIGHSAGFYSEFNNMVLAIIYCQKNGIDLEIYSKYANFGHKNGWTDFFEPFLKESKNPIHYLINERFDNPKGGVRGLLFKVYKLLHPNVLLTADLWNAFRDFDNNDQCLSDLRHDARKKIEQIYIFNNHTKIEITSLMNKVDMAEPYLGFHIRGGDKSIEHELVPIQKYISKAEFYSNIRSAFVSTDDYTFVENLREEYPYWSFQTLTKPSDRGYVQSNFNKLSNKEKKEQLINMFASMEYLSRADQCFCTFSSNIGMFLGMRIGEKAVGVDFDKWRVW